VARAETQVTAYHRIDTGPAERDLVLGGPDLDPFEKRGGDWRTAPRSMLYDWAQDWGVSVNWSHGVPGAPLHGEHHTGGAVGDHREAVFAR
jgi:hypothetical protein